MNEEEIDIIQKSLCDYPQVKGSLSNKISGVIKESIDMLEMIELLNQNDIALCARLERPEEVEDYLSKEIEELKRKTQ